MTVPSKFSPGLRPHVLQGLLILVVTFWIYSPAFHGGWLWDDNVLITVNPLMNDPNGLAKIWLQPGILIDYFPITFSVQRLEWSLWGMDTLGYHLTNVALHIVSAFLVWRLLAKLGLRFAWWGGLIFAVHPVMVESVAWIAELKNTLSLPPLLLAMGAWIEYDASGSKRDYRQALLLFVVAMLCKSSDMMFPTLILLYAGWKRGRLGWGDLRASAPFFAVALLLGGLGAWLEHHHPGPPDFVAATWLSRLATVGHETLFLIALCLFPFGLLPIYASGLVAAPGLSDILPWALIATALAGAWLKRATWGRHVLLGLGFFLLNIVPILGYILMSVTKMVWSMDHLVYLPIIGLIGLMVGGLGKLGQSLPGAASVPAVATAAIVTALLAWQSHAYAGVFRNSLSLWTYACERNPGSWMVRANLGAALFDEGRPAEAIQQDEAAIAINPLYDAVHYNMANALARLGRNADAIQQYEIMTQLNPHFAPAYEQLGNVLAASHSIPAAIDAYEKAVQLNPGLTAVHFSLANLLVQANRLPEAIQQYAEAVESDPGSGALHFALGNALLKANRLPEALNEFEQAAELSPRDLDVRGNLGVTLARMGRLQEAAQQFELMLQIDPKSAAAHTNIGSLFLVAGKFPEAIAQYQEALRLRPDFAEAQQDLARAEAMEKAHPPGQH